MLSRAAKGSWEREWKGGLEASTRDKSNIQFLFTQYAAEIVMTALLRWGKKATMVRPLVLKFLSGFLISFRGFWFFLPSRRRHWPNTSDGERERWMAGLACKSVPSTFSLPPF